MELIRVRSRSGCRKGQALVEMLILLPVLLLLVLAASDIGKLFAILGKCEIAARYTALRVTRGSPFSTLDPAVAASEAERIFFLGTLDDEVEEGERPQDVAYRTPDSGYVLSGIDDPFWNALWPDLGRLGVRPLEARRVRFTYDLISFPYRKWRLLPQPDDGGGSDAWVSPIAFSYVARGNFVAQLDAFSGMSGRRICMDLLGPGAIIPYSTTTGNFFLILYLLGILFP